MPGIRLRFVPLSVVTLLLDIRQHHHRPSEPGRGRGRSARDISQAIRREPASGIDEVLGTEAELLQVIGTLRPAGRFTSGLDGGQKQGDEYTNDGDDDEKLDKREGRT